MTLSKKQRDTLQGDLDRMLADFHTLVGKGFGAVVLDNMTSAINRVYMMLEDSKPAFEVHRPSDEEWKNAEDLRQALVDWPDEVPPTPESFEPHHPQNRHKQ